MTDLRSDSPSIDLLRALNDATGDLIRVLSDRDQTILSAQGTIKKNHVERIRRLVIAHLRQAEEKNEPRDHGSRPEFP